MCEVLQLAQSEEYIVASNFLCITSQQITTVEKFLQLSWGLPGLQGNWVHGPGGLNREILVLVSETETPDGSLSRIMCHQANMHESGLGLQIPQILLTDHL